MFDSNFPTRATGLTKEHGPILSLQRFFFKDSLIMLEVDILLNDSQEPRTVVAVCWCLGLSSPADLNIYELFCFSSKSLTCFLSRDHLGKDPSKPPHVVMELKERFFCGLGSCWRGGRKGPGLAGAFQEKSAAQLLAGRCRDGARRGACRAVLGLAGTQLVWVVEWQAGTPLESTASCGQAEEEPPFGTG